MRDFRAAPWAKRQPVATPTAPTNPTAPSADSAPLTPPDPADATTASKRQRTFLAQPHANVGVQLSTAPRRSQAIALECDSDAIDELSACVTAAIIARVLRMVDVI